MSQRTQYPAYPQRPTARVTLADRARALGAAIVILAILVALPILLVTTFPAVFPDWLLTRTGAEIVLFGGDLQRVALVLFYVGAWVFCLWFAWAVLTEVVAQARNLRRPHLTPVPVGVVGRLVAVLLAAVPVSTAFTPPTAAVAVVAAPLVDGPNVVPDGGPAVTGSEPAAKPLAGSSDDGNAAGPDQDVPAATSSSSRPAEPQLEPYVVRENDTLWGLALSRLGDGRRYPEIYELNREVIGPKPDLLDAGITIRLPARQTAEPVTDGTDDGASSYTVRPGDTLSEIAYDHYGDADRYPDIVAASAGTTQPDGDRLANPDHIEPGWTLTLPGIDAEVLSHPVAPGAGSGPEPAQEPQAEDGSVGDAHLDTPLPAGGVGAGVGDRSPHAIKERDPASDKQKALAPPSDTATNEAPDAPAWLLPGLASGGALLAAGLHVAITRSRSRQERLRTPGRMIAPIPHDLVPVAATARVTGPRHAPDLRRLDLLLRELAGPCLREWRQRPKLLAVELTDEAAILHLAEPTELPEPWSGEGLKWEAPLAVAPTQCAELVPYPMLASVGDDADGHVWLLDLERLRVTTVVGDDDEVAAFGRHLVAELALNPWTVNLTTDAIGVAPGAAGLSRYRVEEHDDASALARFPGELREAYENDVDSEDIEWYHAVFTSADRADQVAELADAILADPGRNGIAVVVLGDGDGSGLSGERLVLRDGQLTLPAQGVEVAAVHLSQQELEASARIAALVRDPPDVAVPVDPEARGWTAFVDRAGSPRADLVEPRPDDPEEIAGERSLLPASDAEYLARTANTREDLARLAPVVPLPLTEVTDGGEASTDADGQADPDPTLDADLADWADKSCTRPRALVLGPVRVWGAGDMTKSTERMPVIVPIFAYLALHPEGVIAAQIGAVAGLEPENARTKVSNLRAWLGEKPDGTLWVPEVQGGRPKKGMPPPSFRLEGALVDADLFLRLRARATRRGADGVDDLKAALRLVRGRPFTVSEHPERWLWATEGEHRDTILTAAIADVAHLVITRALIDDDLDLARWAHKIGASADPAGEVLADDLMLVRLADGHPDQAKEIATELWSRHDDEIGDTDVSERTKEIQGRVGEATRARARG